MAILRNVGHAHGVAVTDAGMGNILAAQVDLTAYQRLQTGQTVDELRLAVAVDTGETDDLAPAHLQGHVLDGVVLVDLASYGHVLYIQHHVAGLTGLFVHMEADIAAHHHGGQLLGGGVFRFHSADVLTLAQDGAAVSHGHDLVELMRDEENGLALGCQIPHDLHQFVDLLRGQHGGGFVEDQDLVVPVEHLQNLGALLHTHGDILDQCVGIHVQTILLAEGQHLFAGVLLLQKAVFRRLGAHDDVVQHREAFHQLEVLVHHADAQGVGVVGILDGHHLTVLFDDALLRLVQAEQNTHQRGFARAVFAQQGVDLALFQLQGDVVVGDNTGEPFGDVQHFNGIR